MENCQLEQLIETHVSKESIEEEPEGKEESERETMDRVYQHQWKAYQKDQERKEKTFLRQTSKQKRSRYLREHFIIFQKR